MITLTSNNPKRLKHLLTVGFMLQFTSWFLEGWMYGTSYGSFFLLQGLKDQNGVFLERIILCTALISVFGLFSEKKPHWSWLLFIYPSLEIINILLMIQDSQKPGVEFSILAAMGRLGLPITLYFLNKSQFSFTKFIEHIFGLFIGLTFIGHGLKALIQEAEYQDYLYFLFGLLPTNTFHSYKLIQNALNTIGVIDIVLGIIIILKPRHKKILLYLFIWGFLTAALRPLYSGSDGLLPFFLRIPHWLIPLSLLIWSHNHKRGTNL